MLDYFADRPEYQADRPVAPAWDGSRVINGIEIVTGTGAADGMKRLLARNAPLAVDSETTGTEPWQRRQVKVVVFGHADDYNAPLAVALDPRDPEQLQLIRQGLAEAPQLLFHNASFDAPALYESGICTDLEWIDRLFDTVVAARLVRRWNETQTNTLAAGLEQSLHTYLNLGDPSAKTFARVKKAHGFSSDADWFASADIDIAAYLVGAAADVVHLPRLAYVVGQYVERMLTSADSVYTNSAVCSPEQAAHLMEREQTVNRVLLRANLRGFEIDVEYAQQYLEAARGRLMELAGYLLSLGWVRDARPDNEPWKRYSLVGEAITDTLVTDGWIDPATWPKTGKGKGKGKGQGKGKGKLSLEKKHLKKCCDPKTGELEPRVAALIEFKELAKTASDYVVKSLNSMHTDGRIRPSTSVLGAVTGRMSYSTIPLQQFDNAARGIIKANNWVSLDWTAVEPVIAAALAGQWDYVEKIENGADPYIPIGREAGVIPADIPDNPPPGLTEKEAEEFPCAKNHKGRKQAKTVLLGLMYGQQLPSLAKSLNLDIAEAEALQQKVFEVIPRMAEYLHGRKTYAEQRGFVWSASGRLMPIERGYNGEWKGYLGQNYTCQGSAYDMLAETIYEAERRGLGDAIHLAMHDELLVDAAAVPEFQDIMEAAMHSLARVAPEAVNHKFVTDNHALPERWRSV